MILITLAVGPTVGGFGLYTVSLGYLPASVANVIATLEPVMTAMLAFVLLGEHFTPPQWAGSLFIIAGVIVLRLSEGRAKILEPAQLMSANSLRLVRYQGAIIREHHILLIRHQEHRQRSRLLGNTGRRPDRGRGRRDLRDPRDERRDQPGRSG